jgi:hypothetical protein
MQQLIKKYEATIIKWNVVSSDVVS